MFGLTDYVLVVTVRGIVTADKKPDDWFAVAKTVRIAAERTIATDIPGNQQVRSDIDKQTYPSSAIKFVYQAFGSAGVQFEQYTAFRNWIQLDKHASVNNRDRIILLRNDLLQVNKQYISEVINQHRVLPDRFDH